MSARPPLLIRADASTAIGTGHIMRTLALAQEWRRGGGDVIFAVAMLPETLRARIQIEKCRIVEITAERGSAEDATQTCGAAAGLIVADGYAFDGTYQDALRAGGARVLLLDDYGHAQRYSADFVLNQNAGAEAALYEKRRAETELLLGPRYALLRREFIEFGPPPRASAPARKLLVTIGGSDPANVTRKVLDALEFLDADLQTRVIAGAANPHLDELRGTVQRFGDRVEILASVADMPAQMAWADCAVSAAGGTCWELLFMGLPAALLTVIDNQRGIARALAAAGAALDLGWHTDAGPRRIADGLRGLLAAPERLADMSRRGRDIVDGEGAARVAMRLEGSRVRVRRAGPQDAERLWHWANDPDVRARAFSTAPIPWADHIAWFGRKSVSPDSLLLVGIDADDLPVGQVRFDSDAEGIATIDISVDRSRRGEGFGLELFGAALRVACVSGIHTARALVKPDNAPSLHLFAAAGFENAGGRDAVEFRLALPTRDPAP